MPKPTRAAASSPSARHHWVGFDLGGTKMQATVFNEHWEPRGEARRKTKGFEGQAEGLARIRGTLEEALASARLKPAQVAGIGVGCPGPLDFKRGVLTEAPNLGWRNVPLRRALERAFGCPVTLVNDVDAGVYGEYVKGAGKGARCLLGVFPGTGIGGGCVYEGRLLTGANQSALEIGHLPVLPNGPLCGCGQRGCLEAVASRLAISAAVAAAAYRGQAPFVLRNAGTQLGDIRSGVLEDAVKAGDKVVERILRDAAKWLGHAIGGLVNVLAPDRIVLGGGLVEALPGLFQEEVERAARARCMSGFRDEFKVVVARLGDRAGALGAAAWARAAQLPRAT
jgi:glucokinase